MISRSRLHEADKHAIRRWKANCYYLYSGVPAPDWRLWRKVTKHCSGPCCGNPRRHFGQLTRQEKRDWSINLDV